MKLETRDALVRINRQMYSAAADDFDRTRQNAWPGWKRLVAELDGVAVDEVLDVGCGNGRFGSFLDEHLGRPFFYTGLDFSEELLDAARIRFGDRADRVLRLVELADAGDWAGVCQYEVTVSLAVLHHLPGAEQRLDFVRLLARSVVPGGRLVLSFWRFLDVERLRRRVLTRDEVIACDFGLDPDDLETGDAILTWGGDSPAHRYCHHHDDQEIAALIVASGLSVLADFLADGREGNLNRYLVLG